MKPQPVKDTPKADGRPECVHCKAPIDTRRNRTGWMHDMCEKATHIGGKRSAA